MTTRTCSFCNQRKHTEREKVFTGAHGVIICSTCMYQYAQDFGLREAQPDEVSGGRSTPQQIKEYLDQHIVGQERAKKALAVAVYNHYKRVKLSDEAVNSERSKEGLQTESETESGSHPSAPEVMKPDERIETLSDVLGSVADVKLTKGNVLMIGPTGVGKTAIAERIATLLDVPFVVKDATTLTSAGYVGEDVESIIHSLWEAADRDVELTERGIVLIDEIDKIARKGSSGGSGAGGRDVGGEGVQQSLLKLIESNLVNIQAEANSILRRDLIQVDTTNILFIFCGAFVGIEQLIQQRMRPGTIGFGARSRGGSAKEQGYDELIEHIRTDDLIRYGLIPEFIGRLPVLVPMSSLDAEAMREVLWKPKSSLVRQYQRLLDLSEVELEFSDDALDEIVEQALKRKSGARGLRSVIERVMLKVMYEIPDLTDPSDEMAHSCLITAEVVRGERDAIISERKIESISPV